MRYGDTVYVVTSINSIEIGKVKVPRPDTSDPCCEFVGLVIDGRHRYFSTDIVFRSLLEAEEHVKKMLTGIDPYIVCHIHGIYNCDKCMGRERYYK